MRDGRGSSVIDEGYLDSFDTEQFRAIIERMAPTNALISDIEVGRYTVLASKRLAREDVPRHSSKDISTSVFGKAAGVMDSLNYVKEEIGWIKSRYRQRDSGPTEDDADTDFSSDDGLPF